MRLLLLSCGMFFVCCAAFAQPGADAGSLRIHCPSGFRIEIDGKPAGVCPAAGEGLLIPNITPGEHVVIVRKSGFVPAPAKVSIQSGAVFELKVSPLTLRRRIHYRPQEEPVDMTVESPPMFADDTGTPGDRNVELNFTFDGDLSHDRNRGELPLVDINYGVGENVQLKYEVPWVFERTVETDAMGQEHRSNAHGIADSTLGVKYRFFDDEASHLSIAVYPQVEFRTPGAKTENNGGVAAGGTTWIVPLLVTKELEHLAMTGNAGVEWSTSDGTSLTGAFGLGTRLSDQIAVLSEIGGENLNRSDQRRLFLNAGFRRKLDNHQTVGAAIGRDLHAGDGQKHTYIRFSYQRYFGEK